MPRHLASCQAPRSQAEILRNARWTDYLWAGPIFVLVRYGRGASWALLFAALVLSRFGLSWRVLIAVCVLGATVASFNLGLVLGESGAARGIPRTWRNK